MRTQRRILGLLVVLLLISSWLPSGWARRVSSGPRDMLVALLTPAGWMQATVAPITRRSELPDNREGDSPRHRDYDEAIRQIENLRIRLEQANRRITQLSAIRGRPGMQGVTLHEARVIQRAGRPGHEVVTLNIGAREGVTLGLAVVDGVNLVGRVIGVTAGRSTIRPINNIPSHLAARVKAPQAKPDRATAPMLLKADKDGRRFTERISVGLKVMPGDWAHLADRNWPNEAQGFVIGHVTEVAKDQDDPLQHRIVTVMPLHSVDMLHDVTVLVPVQTMGGDN